jgi:hypothetical protein
VVEQRIEDTRRVVGLTDHGVPVLTGRVVAGNDCHPGVTHRTAVEVEFRLRRARVVEYGGNLLGRRGAVNPEDTELRGHVVDSDILHEDLLRPVGDQLFDL